MVREVLLGSNHHENKWFCEAETPAEVYICKLHSALENTSFQFAWYGKKPIIHELITFGCDI